jgi:hypothetical protein
VCGVLFYIYFLLFSFSPLRFSLSVSNGFIFCLISVPFCVPRRRYRAEYKRTAETREDWTAIASASAGGGKMETVQLSKKLLTNKQTNVYVHSHVKILTQ